MTDEAHPLERYPLPFLAFEKVRRVGVARANGNTVTHEGIAHRMTVQTTSTIKTVHIVLEAIDGPIAGHQRAMAIIETRQHGYRGEPAGLDLVLPALHNGIRVYGHPLFYLDYRVLPCLPVPRVFLPTGHDRQ